jgi:RNA polymerase sigma-70 factor (ECF subfamily)
MIQTDDLGCIDAVLDGNKDAFADLVDRYKDMVFTLAVGMLRDGQEAEEAAQDAFVKAYRSLKAYKRKAKFSTWLYRIAYNECVSRLRKRKADTISIEEYHAAGRVAVVDQDQEEPLDPEEQRRLLSEALGRLPESDRSIVLLYYYEDLPVDDIARITSLTVSNVKIKLFRARKKLQHELRPVIKSHLATRLTPSS